MQTFQAYPPIPGFIWLFPLIHVAIVVLVLVMAWRVMRALERMAACMERSRGEFGGPSDITTS